MSKYKKLSHVVYKCEYQIVWVPKYRFRILTGKVKELIEEDVIKRYVKYQEEEEKRIEEQQHRFDF